MREKAHIVKNTVKGHVTDVRVNAALTQLRKRQLFLSLQKIL